MIILHLIDPCLAVYWLVAPGTAARSPIHAAVSDLRLDEGEQVGIDDVRMGRRHPVGKSLVNLERGILDQFGLQQRCIPVGYYLVVITLHHKSRHRDRLQIVGLVCLRESLDAFVVGERASRHSLAPPILDGPLRSLRAGSIESIEGTR